MDSDGFWGLVDVAREQVDDTVADPDGVADALIKELGALPAEEIVGFGVRFELLMSQAYRWDLWGAAYLLNGGLGDDGFDHFRGWLVAQGRETFEAAVSDPDSLADVIDEDLQDPVDLFDGEAVLAVGAEAYSAVAGSEKAFWAAVDAGTPDSPEVPAGAEFDFDDRGELADRFPRLAAIYLEV